VDEDLARPSVLIVDDESAVLDLLGVYLREHGCEVRTAASGEAALAELERESVQAVVLDLGLPGVDGLEVCRRLRRAGNHVPIIVLSALDREHDKVQALAAGADDYLTKPFGLRELLARVRAALRRSGPRQPAGDSDTSAGLK
jgi:two-component system response regulator MprA